MRITRRQIRRIIREEYYSKHRADDPIMSEGLLDFLGSLFGGLIDFFTGAAEEAMRKFVVPNWVEQVHRRRFRWAGHVARMTNKHVVHDIVLWRNSQWDYERNRPLKKQRAVRFMQFCLCCIAFRCHSRHNRVVLRSQCFHEI